MSVIHEQSLASLVLELEWQSREARHQERYLARRVNVWRDIFPPRMQQSLLGKSPGDEFYLEYQPGEAIPAYDQKLIYRVPRTQFNRRVISARKIPLRQGRFYPRGMLGNIIGIHPQDARPGRVIDMDEQTMTVDLNHPLAGQELKLRATVLDMADKTSETGGRLASWMEELADTGPGMQARHGGRPTQFGSLNGLRRDDESDDALFYASPRIIGHVDSRAAAFLQEIYASVLKPGARVLDLMSNVHSHLPEDRGLDVTGLGLNREELEANPLLARRVIHDLNDNPELPFADKSFDNVVCSLSIEYLTDPRAVLAQCIRALRPGGTLLIGFSNRWFPDKAVWQWVDLHEFERLGLVLECFRELPALQDLHTVSIRNWWRPGNDPHINETDTSDPVYVVMGVAS
ncbi:MAG TPA: methyltransferase domain-containing protein [Desulfonatronum sp.]|nr:methyltransferase domain-containing protein [Desulfonatronum sp.]